MKSIKTKLILGITALIVIALAIIISVSVIKSTNTIEEVTNYQYQERIKTSTNVLKMNLYQQFKSVDVKDGNLIASGNTINIAQIDAYLDTFASKMEVEDSIYIKDGSNFISVSTTLKDSNGERLVGTTLDSSSPVYKELINGKTYYGTTTINGKEYMAGYQPMYKTDKADGEIIGIIETVVPTTKINSMISSSKNKTITIIILTAIIIFILSIIDIYIISSIVAKQIKEASYMVKELKLGHYNYRLKNKLKDEMGQMSRDMNELADDLQNVVLADMKKISAGDVNIELIPKDENDELTPTLMEMVNSIKDLVYETKNLAIEAENGNLNARGDAEKFKGEYINIVNAINGTLEAVANPMKEAIRVMGDLSVGKLGSTINGTYNGDYAKLIDAVNKMARTLTYVLNEISEIITRIADADLNITDITNYDGDFNKVTVAFNNIIENLNATMREINAAAVQVAAGSGQIADSSVMLSQGSEEQASSIEEITSAITQMAAQVNENAQNAAQADSLSRSAKGSAIKGNEEMHKMLEAMHEINEASNGISKIIKVIDDIAFQTNILALNAAVEAARAGQYGKGFAVVAEEVRNLAQKSAAAAKETTVMIESSIDKVKFGTEIANSTEQALEEIVGNVSKSSELVSHIASASNEQASAISQVSQAIEQVSGVVQTNSATAEETASASEELTSQAQMLKSMVNKFKLKDDSINSSVSIPKINEAKKSSIDLEAFETDINKSMKNTQIDLGKDF